METNKKQPMKKRTKFTIAAIVNIIWYTIAVLVLSFFDHTVPSELTVAWFSAWTVELALLAGITLKSKSSIAETAIDDELFVDDCAPREDINE